MYSCIYISYMSLHTYVYIYIYILFDRTEPPHVPLSQKRRPFCWNFMKLDIKVPKYLTLFNT